MKRKLGRSPTKTFDLQHALQSFKDASAASIKAFNEAENERLDKLLKAEEKRQKIEQKQDQMMLNLFAKMLGGDSCNLPNDDDNSHE